MPIWDSYLTARDKQHLALRQFKKKAYGFGKRPALLVVDVYYGAVGDKPLPLLDSVKTWPDSCGQEGWNAVHAIKKLLEVARKHGVLVVYSTNTQNIRDFLSFEGKSRQPALPERLRSMEYEIVREIEPEEGELVLHKTATSCFFGTPLVQHLIKHGIDTVMVCGESTSGCVRATVVDGWHYRFRIGVVEECTFDRHQATHAINLFDMNQKFADVVPLAEAVSYFERVDVPK